MKGPAAIVCQHRAHCDRGEIQIASLRNYKVGGQGRRSDEVVFHGRASGADFVLGPRAGWVKNLGCAKRAIPSFRDEAALPSPTRWLAPDSKLWDPISQVNENRSYVAGRKSISTSGRFAALHLAKVAPSWTKADASAGSLSRPSKPPRAPTRAEALTG